MGLTARADDSQLIIASEPGDPIGGGQQTTWAVPDKGVRASASYYDGTRITVGSAGTVLVVAWEIQFTLPWSGLPKPGVYTVSSADPYSRAIPHLSVRTPSRGYFAPEGTFEIKKCTFSNTGLASLWVTFDLHMPGSTGAFRAEARFHADSTEPGVNQAPTAVTLLQDLSSIEVPLALEAHLADDDLPAGATPTSTWEILGAGAAYGEIADPTATLTTVTFHEPGFYNLRLHVSDGEKSSDWPRRVQVSVPLQRNLLHVAGPSSVMRYSAGEFLDVQPPFSYGAGSSLDGDSFDYWKNTSRVQANLSRNNHQFPSVGTYEVPAEGIGSVFPAFSYNLGEEYYSVPAARFEVRAGSRPTGDTLAAAAWVTFSSRGAEDEPAALGELRYNIASSAVLNAPPIVDAGLDREFTRTSIRRLHGAAMAVVGASDAPLTTAWSVTSGPGQVTFTDSAAQETGVTFSAPGVYRLRLTATQGAGTSWDETTVSVYTGETSLVVRDLTGRTSNYARYITPEDYDFRVTKFTGNSLQVACDKRHPAAVWNADEHWLLRFEAPAGAQLAVKSYIDDGFPSSTQATLTVAHDDSYQQFVGSFTISELSLDGNGQPASLRLTFSEFAMTGDGTRDQLPLYGEFRFRTDVSHDAANRAPKVSVGPPQYLCGRTGTVLSAALDDDLLPLGKPLKHGWEMVSGPGTATFTSSNPTTVATFSEPGVYLLRYAASDGEYSVGEDVTVVVGSSAETYQGYVSENSAIYGIFQLRLLPSGHFTGSVKIGTSQLPLQGNFANGTWTKTAPLRDGSYLSVTLSRSLTDGAVNGTITFSGHALSLLATQGSGAFLHAAKEASPFAAAYTWITELPAINEGPYGYSFGTAKVSRNGAARLTGKLSDGRAFSYGGSIGLDGWLPVYWTIPLTEQFAGPVQFHRAADGLHCLGSVPWQRNQNPKSARFPAGFGFVTKLIGTRYTPPARGKNLLVPTTEPVAISAQSYAPSWPGGRLDDVTMKSNNTFVSHRGFTMTADPRTGLFRGSVLDPQGKPRTFGGAFLQGSGFGGGFFSAGSDAGVVYIKAN